MTTATDRGVLQQIIREAWSLSPEIGATVDEVLSTEPEPVTDEALRRVLTRVVEAIKATPQFHEDRAAANDLVAGVDAFVTRLLDEKAGHDERGLPLVKLEGRGIVQPGPVAPTPVFHHREVQMRKGFVRADDIRLWEGNERLEIHLAQFRHQFGRAPTDAELLDIMLSRITLPGIEAEDRDDQFEIVKLARSMASSGVRVPPIIDLDGTLLDGNRRVAACTLIRHSDDFTMEEKKRVEWIFVHQLTEFATDADRDAVVVACNFEPDNKVDWPEYVKARKVADAWQEILDALAHMPNKGEAARMKRDLSKRFGLGPETGTVNRYLKMVAWAGAFEIHQVAKRGKDEYEVKHKASKYFQYFDELAKGSTKPGGVAYTLENDDRFREIVFDLLFDGKFRNWRQIRDLKLVHTNEDAMTKLKEALEEPDLAEAQELLDDSVSIARMAQASARELGANTRIEQFTKFLRELPVSAFTDTITRENLRRLREALALVDVQAKAVLGE